MLKQILNLPQTVSGGLCMNKFVSGVFLGSAVAMAGYTLMCMSEYDKRKAVRKGKRIINKAENAIDDFAHDIW